MCKGISYCERCGRRLTRSDRYSKRFDVTTGDRLMEKVTDIRCPSFWCRLIGPENFVDNAGEIRVHKEDSGAG